MKSRPLKLKVKCLSELGGECLSTALFSCAIHRPVPIAGPGSYGRVCLVLNVLCFQNMIMISRQRKIKIKVGSNHFNLKFILNYSISTTLN